MSSSNERQEGVKNKSTIGRFWLLSRTFLSRFEDNLPFLRLDRLLGVRAEEHQVQTELPISVYLRPIVALVQVFLEGYCQVTDS